MVDNPRTLVSAEQLRAEILEQELARMREQEALLSVEEKQRSAFAEDFLNRHVGPEELQLIRRVVEFAVRHGEMEALVYSFPSSLCTDDGRAINNAAPNWPETLQGKAKELYDEFERRAKPAGYRLKAMIINFPGGIPGDVGFYLSWAPPLTDKA